MNDQDNKKELSTSALGKELNKSSQEIFQELSEMGFITRRGNAWELTSVGKLKGGTYREHDRYRKYIVWPASMIEDFKSAHGRTNLLTSTSLGKHFEISATRTNSILSELNLIEKGVKGWKVTELGKKLGGIQSQDKVSGIPYVRWPESLKNNKMLIASIQEIKGDIPMTTQVQTQNSATEGTEFRDKFKTGFRATDGHYVRSKAEMLIDNWLYMSELVHAYERRLPIEEDVYSDFYLPIGKVYIEYWGYDEDPKYSSRKSDKIKIYEKNGFRLIQLSDKEVQNLDDSLPRLLLAFGIRTE